MSGRRRAAVHPQRVYDRAGALLEAEMPVLVRTERGWLLGVVAGFDQGGNVSVRLSAGAERTRTVWAFPIDVEATRQGTLFDQGATS